MLYICLFGLLAGFCLCIRRKNIGVNGGFDDKFYQDVGTFPERWFEEQIVDHFNPLNFSTYRQRYFENTTYLEKEDGKCGPIFLEIGGEGSISERYVNGAFTNLNWAEKFGGAIVALEHRYYGKSIPTGDDVSTKTLNSYLSSQQAIADLVTFIPYWKAKNGCPLDTKVIVSGGSYPGSLASYSRSQHPHAIDGAIASSGPFLAKLDYPEYFEHVSYAIKKYADRGVSCIKSINNVFTYIDDAFTSNNEQKINEINELFAPLTEKFILNPKNFDNMDVAHFVESLSDAIAGVIQYAVVGTINTISNMCEGFLLNVNLDSPITSVTAFSKAIRDENFMGRSGYSKTAKIESRFADIINELTFDRITLLTQNNLESRSWLYQTCREFGYYQTGIESVNNKRVSIDYFYKICKDIYDINEEWLKRNIKRTNHFYGGRNIPTTNIYFANGDIDPWSELSVDPAKKWKDGQFIGNNKNSKIEGSSHCGDLYSNKNGENKDAIDIVRKDELCTIAKWLNFDLTECK